MDSSKLTSTSVVTTSISVVTTSTSVVTKTVVTVVADTLLLEKSQCTGSKQLLPTLPDTPPTLYFSVGYK